MTRNADRQAFLVVTNNISSHVLKLCRRLQKATAGSGDVILLYHFEHGQPVIQVKGLTVEIFTNDILTSLNYKPIQNQLVPGSNHFPVLDFFLHHPEYKYYWCIEDDVTFSGNWKDFFSAVSPHLPYDFISSHIRNHENIPGWYWWDTMKIPGEKIDKNGLLHSFNPIYRISKSALEYIDHCLRNGYSGHHEVLLPTLLNKQGFTIADLSNEDNHLTPWFSFCTLRTMRWKPVFLFTGIKKNTLYHPVKAKISFAQLLIYLERSIKNKKKYLP
jgi:hypothetical protein